MINLQQQCGCTWYISAMKVISLTVIFKLLCFIDRHDKEQWYHCSFCWLYLDDGAPSFSCLFMYLRFKLMSVSVPHQDSDAYLNPHCRWYFHIPQSSWIFMALIQSSSTWGWKGRQWGQLLHLLSFDMLLHLIQVYFLLLHADSSQISWNRMKSLSRNQYHLILLLTHKPPDGLPWN